MLVLSRRPNQKIVFPQLGISIQIVGNNGKTVRLGIDAPPHVRIAREELTGPLAALPKPAGQSDHEWANHLSRISLALHLAQRQREAGLIAESDATLARLFQTLEEIDRQIEVSRARKAAARPTPAVTRRALLVEDDHNERELLAGLLRMGGCQCDAAADGEQALAYLAAHERPDVVLLDLLMPRCDGRETLAAIRRDPRLQDLKVFAVSGTSPESLGIRTGPGGLDAWFAKPLNPRKLWDAITLDSRN